MLLATILVKVFQKYVSLYTTGRVKYPHLHMQHSMSKHSHTIITLTQAKLKEAKEECLMIKNFLSLLVLSFYFPIFSFLAFCSLFFYFSIPILPNSSPDSATKVPRSNSHDTTAHISPELQRNGPKRVY